MAELKRLLLEHKIRYPLMQLLDCVKLLYQNEYGSEHMVSDRQASLLRIQREYDDSAPADRLYEDIGNSILRINLGAAKQAALSPTAINKLFIMSSLNSRGNNESFIRKLEYLKNLCDSSELPYNGALIPAIIAEFIYNGFQAFRHSDEYRKAYKPSYRVVNAENIKYLPLIELIDKQMLQKEHVVLAIDGRCGSGKTMLAELLSKTYSSPVIHMDDFFLPLSLRTEDRLSSPGGNIHSERFMDEVIAGLESGAAFSYRKFDCSLMDYRGAQNIEPSPLIIIEGSYSMLPEFSKMYDISVFLEVDSLTQRKRLTKRDPLLFKRFEEEWIPLEEKYFEAFNIPFSCDIIINNN